MREASVEDVKEARLDGGGFLRILKHQGFQTCELWVKWDKVIWKELPSNFLYLCEIITVLEQILNIRTMCNIKYINLWYEIAEKNVQEFDIWLLILNMEIA